MTVKTFLSILLLACAHAAFSQIHYPPTKTVNQTDTVFGHVLRDPYRWLENQQSDEVKTWVSAQQQLTDSMLSNLNGVDSLFARIDRFNHQGTWWRLPAFQTPQKTFFFKSDRNQPNVKLYARTAGDTTERLLFDTWAIHPGVRYTFSALKFSPDGRYFLLALDQNGEEYPFVKVYDTQVNGWLNDSIPHCYDGTLHWLPDSKGFIYGYNLGEIRGDTSNYDKEVFKLHRLGTGAENDRVVLNYETGNRVEPLKKGFYADLFILGHQAFCQPNQGFENDYANVFVKPATDLQDSGKPWQALYSQIDSVHDFKNFSVVTARDYYFVSAKGRGFRSLRKTSVRHPDFGRASIVLEEDTEWMLDNIAETRSFVLVHYLKYGFLRKTVFIDKATGAPVPMHALSRLDRCVMMPLGKQTDDCFVSNLPVNRPRQSFRLDAKNDRLYDDPFWAVQNQVLLEGYDDIFSEVVEVPSHDGVMVPLIITRSRKTPLDGNNVCIMAGYGAYGFNESYYIYFNPVYSLLMQQGVVFADALVRGGGAKGEAWHLDGMKATKPNSWKDFIACAEYLVGNRYTRPEKLACKGGSAGGIVVGRAITDRPDLFRAAHIQSGSLNVTRNAAYENGINNIPEYGSPFIKNEFDGLVEMDPLLHVRPHANYPAVYISTGINDHRVAPWMPFKFAATLQACSDSGLPVLLHTDLEGGHFGDANAKTLLERFKGQFRAEAFLLWQCGHPNFQKRAN